MPNQPVRTPRDLEDREAGERLLPVVEELGVVDLAGLAGLPVAVADVEGARWPPANHILERLSFTTRLRQHPFLEREEQAAPDERKQNQRHRGAVEADAARPHDRQLTRP